MSQLATAPRQLSARQLKKFKEIRKVKAAIKWHERARKQRQAIAKERYESKQASLNQIRWVRDNVTKPRRKAIDNAREDWLLGPLRPNRAVGAGAEKYGAMTTDQMRTPDITARVQKRKNDIYEKKGLEAEYPLIVDDEKYFPIAKGDRVVVLKGREKNKIGTIREIYTESHQAVVEGINMHYVDSAVFNAPPGETLPPMRETEVPINLSDLRLVIPYQTIKYSFDEEGNRMPGRKIIKDVIVDKIVMERHTTGIDPFTGTDYGEAEIPKEHQYDPHTGLPIFHRYIAGTRHEIEWPWQKSEEIEASQTEEIDPLNQRTALRKLAAVVRHPKVAWNRMRNRGEVAKPKGQTVDDLVQEIGLEYENIEASEKSRMVEETPRSEDKQFTEAYDGNDTTRNLVEEGQDLRYTLVHAPYPPEIVDELRDSVFKLKKDIAKEENANKDPLDKEMEKAWAEFKDPEVQEKLIKEQDAIEKMKTPLQLRWERDQAKKLAAEYENPRVDPEALLIALGQHMQNKGVRLTAERKKAAGVLEELD